MGGGGRGAVGVKQSKLKNDDIDNYKTADRTWTQLVGSHGELKP